MTNCIMRERSDRSFGCERSEPSRQDRAPRSDSAAERGPTACNCDANIEDSDGNTPLVYAEDLEFMDIANILRDHNFSFIHHLFSES